MAGNFPKLMKDIQPLIQESHATEKKSQNLRIYMNLHWLNEARVGGKKPSYL